jgi:hypothetical protein
MRIHINIPDELVNGVDELAGPGKRSEYITAAVQKAVRKDRLVRAIEKGAGMLSDEDYPHWSTPEKVAEWLRDLRNTPSIRRDPVDEVLAGRERADRLAEGKGTGRRPRKTRSRTS